MAQFLSQHDIGPGLRHLLRAAAADVAVVIAVEPVEQDIRVDAAPDVALATGESELSTTIQIQLSEVAEGADGARILTLPWTRPSPYRKREIIQGANDAKTYARPMPANARGILIEALRDAHRWLDELLSDPRLTLESIASRENKSERSIRMTLSLAFLAPEIVKAAVERRLPRGFGLKRLVDLPMAWADQWRALGLQAPTRTRDEPVANSNTGNGNWRPETFDRSRRQ